MKMINTCILSDTELKLEKKVKIRVEPGIFEWTKWEAGKSAPTLMTLEELREANVNVSTEYRCAFRTLSAAGVCQFLLRAARRGRCGGNLQRGDRLDSTLNVIRTRGDLQLRSRVWGWWVEKISERVR